MKPIMKKAFGTTAAMIFCLAVTATSIYAMGNKQAAPPATTTPVKKAESSATKAAAGELVGLLTSQLGVTKPQAEGGAGSIFSLAKSKMSPSDFGQIASVVPDMDTLLKAAPAVASAGNTANSV